MLLRTERIPARVPLMDGQACATRARTQVPRPPRDRLSRDAMKGSASGMARQSSFTYEELLACGRGELFGPGNAQLPLPPMLMFDRITSIGEEGGAYGKGHVLAEL